MVEGVLFLYPNSAHIRILVVQKPGGLMRFMALSDNALYFFGADDGFAYVGLRCFESPVVSAAVSLSLAVSSVGSVVDIVRACADWWSGALNPPSG